MERQPNDPSENHSPKGRGLKIALAVVGVALAACAAWHQRTTEKRDAEARHDTYVASQHQAETQRAVDRRFHAELEAKRLAELDRVAAAQTATLRAEKTDREREQERLRALEAERHAEKLQALSMARDSGRGCDAFADLGPLAVSRAAAQAGQEGVTNDCADSAKAVRCHETASGYFVPVSIQRAECVWGPWYVPKSKGDPVEIPIAAPGYEEFDIAFSVDTFLEDFGKGPELVVVRGYAHPEGVGDSTNAIRHLADGRVVPTPFSALRDEDRDGQRDGILIYGSHEDDVCALPEDVWARIHHVGPTLVARRTPDGKFSLLDPAARSSRAKACADSSGAPVVVDQRGNVDDRLTAQRLLCQAADGVPIESLLNALRRKCSGPPKLEHCPKRRPGTCFRDTLEHWLGSLRDLGTVHTPP